MVNWLRAIWQRLLGKPVKPNVVFNERERVDPVLHLVKDAPSQMNDVKVVDRIVMQWVGGCWQSVCYLPKQDEVRSEADLPKMAPVGWRYECNGRYWTWDGTCWVTNYQDWVSTPNSHLRHATSAHHHRSAVTQSTTTRVADPHPTDSGLLMTAMVAGQAWDDGGSNHSGRSSSNNHHDSGYSNDGGGDGGGSCD